MLIADDCSTDKTPDIVHEWELRDSRIKLIRCTVNGGPAMARNAAINEANGSWIAFLDSDDIWLPEKLEISLRFAKENNAAFLFTGFRRTSFDGGTVGKYNNVPRTINYSKLLCNTIIATSTVMINREVVGDFRMTNSYYDDFVCWLSLLKNRCEIAHGIDQDLMRYRMVKKSISRNKINSAIQVWKIYRNEENLNIFFAFWCFFNYSIRGVLKYRKL